MGFQFLSFPPYLFTIFHTRYSLEGRFWPGIGNRATEVLRSTSILSCSSKEERKRSCVLKGFGRGKIDIMGSMKREAVEMRRLTKNLIERSGIERGEVVGTWPGQGGEEGREELRH